VLLGCWKEGVPVSEGSYGSCGAGADALFVWLMRIGRRRFP
jgi:hypothetical protein